MLELALWQHPDYAASELRCLAGEIVDAVALGRQGDLDWWIYQLTEADDTAIQHMSRSEEDQSNHQSDPSHPPSLTPTHNPHPHPPPNLALRLGHNPPSLGPNLLPSPSLALQLLSCNLSKKRCLMLKTC
ncbi:TPA: hypothetical protein ACH3X1_006120 [Trebouxia sp. C0004]